MLSNNLVKALAPFALMINKNALSQTYKVLEVHPERIRSASAFGILEANISLGLSKPFVVDALSFIAIIKSLPDREPVELEIKGETLHWSAGMATGKLALIKCDKLPTIEDVYVNPGEAVDVPANFVNGLQLGGLSCGDNSLASAGIFGVVLDNRTNLMVYSSDDITISSSEIGESIGEFPEQIALSPDAVAALTAVLGKDAAIAVDEKMVCALSGDYQMLLKTVPPLKHDIAKIREPFTACQHVAKLDPDRINAFIKRTTALAESSRHAYVEIAAAQGAISLSFTEDKAASEEYYLAEGLEVPELPPIKVQAARMAKALAHADSLVLDHIGKSVLVLTGKNFSYMMTGKRDR